MRRTVLSAVPVALVSLAALTGCGGGSPEETYEGAEPAEFAQVSCTAWTEMTAADEKLSDYWDTLTGTGEEQHATAVSLAEEAIAGFAAHRDAIAEVQPAVKDGEDIVALFTEYFDARTESATAALDAFRATPTELGPNGDRVQIAAIELFSAIEMSKSEPDFPFTQIEDQDVLKAFDAEPACEDVVGVVTYP